MTRFFFFDTKKWGIFVQITLERCPRAVTRGLAAVASMKNEHSSRCGVVWVVIFICLLNGSSSPYNHLFRLNHTQMIFTQFSLSSEIPSNHVHSPVRWMTLAFSYTGDRKSSTSELSKRPVARSFSVRSPCFSLLKRHVQLMTTLEL